LSNRFLSFFLSDAFIAGQNLHFFSAQKFTIVALNWY